MKLSAQTDSSLLDLLEDESTSLPEFEEATFKTTRIINGHSIENVYNGVLELRISHRFGSINNGMYDLFGLDQASMKINLDYGIFPWLTAGFGRTNQEKTFDGYLKVKLLRQKTSKMMPITLSAISGISISTLEWSNKERKNYFSSRLNYYHQILIARKFTETFSCQISPTLIHRNLISDNTLEKNDVFSLGLGLRRKLTKRTSLNIEYFINNHNAIRKEHRNILSVGFDIETGGHVFQLHFTNSTYMHEKAFIAQTTDSWLQGGIHFGFNISRVFTIKNE